MNTAHWTNETGWELPTQRDEAAHRAKYPADWGRYDYAAKLVSGKRVVDCACGPGYGAWVLARAGAVGVVGVDTSSEAISWAKKEFAHPAIEYALGTGSGLPVPPSSFDVAVSFETIEHIPEDKAGAFVEAFATALKPGGLFVISTPLTEGPSRLKPANPFHKREYDSRELSHLLSPWFEVTEHLGQHSAGSDRFSRLKGVPGVGALIRNGMHRALPAPLRRAARTLLNRPGTSGAESWISAERWTEAPVQVLVGRRK